MVVDVETRAANVAGGRMAARACDACIKISRASWYCPADDAFLCQSCDTSIHSANHLAKRHERVRLQSSSSSPELMKTTNTEDKTTSVWFEGFRRKARTPRNKGLAFEKLLQIDSNDPLVPELGEEEEDCFFSEESLNCCVPVLDPFSDMVIDDNNFGLVPDGVDNREELGEIEKAIMDDEGLIGFFPLDMDLGVLTMDVESLLEEEQRCLELKEPNDIGVAEKENNIGFEINCTALKNVKDEVEEEAKCENDDRKTSLFLRLDYESVIISWASNGSPWKTEIKPEFNLDDSWRECLLEGNTCLAHVEELASAVGSGTRQQGRGGGGSDGEREARVLRYKEKRRTRLFSKKIRYEVRKLNAEQRPRIKGRFVKTTSFSDVM